MTNKLNQETSPYLLQHAGNPVDWYPWGEEALQRARAEDRPILLSIGYSACHWCHVMAHESFENPEIARQMNESFVNIKVDREERPDLDAIYMQAVQALTGRGGWPMTVFLTPEGTPYYGGTYFPPADRGGMPGFPRVLAAMADAYRTRREDVAKSAQQLLEHLQRNEGLTSGGAPLSAEILDDAFAALARDFDERNGGFRGAPKFPQPMALEFLLRCFGRTGSADALKLVEISLRQMANGGIYDQIGGGFHRYSTDDHWLVPHFEKMLYDNAQLARIYLYAFQATGAPFYRRIVEETLDYVLREMTSPEGGFYSTQDADSEGVEGKFFVWTPDEIVEVLGAEDAGLFGRYFDVSAQGNFEGKNILHVAGTVESLAAQSGVRPERVAAAIERGRGLLFNRRERRIKPGLDDKIVTAWNGMMLRAMAEAGRVLDRSDYISAAERNAEFLQTRLVRDGTLLRTYRAGQSKLAGYLEDHACLANGLLSLYEATFDSRWFVWARQLGRTMIDRFGDREHGGFFDTSDGHEQLLVRPRDLFDNATPSGNSAASEALLRLSAFTGDADEQEWGRSPLTLLASALGRHPSGFGRALCALDFALSSPKEIAIVGSPEREQTRALVRAVFASYLPNKVVAGAAPDDRDAKQSIPLLRDRLIEGERSLAYVCEYFACQMPVSEPEALRRQLGLTLAG